MKLGRLVATNGIDGLMKTDTSFAKTIDIFLGRYVNGDWGDLCAEDKATNESALQYGDRVLGAYDTDHGKVYIITEADRTVTTILFASEY